MSDHIYRVTRKHTTSLQPCGTTWRREVLYCGTNRTAARTAYHGSTPADGCRGYGNSATETIVEVITDGYTLDFEDDAFATENP